MCNECAQLFDLMRYSGDPDRKAQKVEGTSVTVQRMPEEDMAQHAASLASRTMKSTIVVARHGIRNVPCTPKRPAS